MDTEKCPFIGIDCEYIPLARKFDAQAKEIVRLQEALRLAGNKVEPLASFQQKDIGSSTIRVGEETKFSRDARSFNGEK
jgi:hypothetical protein